MSPRIKPMIAIALILVLCHVALDQGEAKVVRSGKNGPVNPPVEVGGYRPTKASPGNISYDIIVGAPLGYGWFAPCVLWSWNLVRPFRLHGHRPVARMFWRPLRVGPLPGFPPPFR
jgi:hypothetical protein